MNRESQNRAREELRKDLVRAIGKSNNTLIELPTGAGKTGIALEQALKQSGKSKPTLRFYVPETSNILSTNKEINDRGYRDKFEAIDVLCYRSIHTIDEPMDVTIYDETHHLFGEVTYNNFLRNKGDVNIFISATIKDEQKVQLREALPDLKEYSKSHQDAVDMGILPDADVYIWRITPDEVLRNSPVKYGKDTYFVSQKACIDKFAKDIRYFQEIHRNEGKPYALNRVKRLGSERKRFLSSMKVDIMKEMLKHIRGRKIVFCGSVEQATEVGGNEYSITGKNTKKVNDEKFRSFNDGEIDTLVAVNKLQEGVNLVDCRTAVLQQLGNQDIEFIQKRGRVLRGLEPIIHLIVVDKTKDQDFLESTLEHINPDSIRGDYLINDLYDVKPLMHEIYG